MAIVYKAAIYTQEIEYTNFNGEDRTASVQFSLHPIALMAVFASIPDKKIKSGNPALNGKTAEISDEQQIKLVRDLAARAAGRPSEDGENWFPFEDFETSLIGQAFMLKLITTDQTRREFSDKVILTPFRAFVEYAEVDPSNSPREIKDLKDMLVKLENTFKTPDPADETAADRKARLMAELSLLDDKTNSGVVVE